MITSSYIEDMSSLWTEVHPALLEVKKRLFADFGVDPSTVQVTRWLEPFIDYGLDYHRATPLYDATIALGRYARDLFNKKGRITEPVMFSTTRANNVSPSQTLRTPLNNPSKANAFPLQTPLLWRTKGSARRDGVHHEQRRFARSCCRRRERRRRGLGVDTPREALWRVEDPSTS